MSREREGQALKKVGMQIFEVWQEQQHFRSMVVFRPPPIFRTGVLAPPELGHVLHGFHPFTAPLRP